MYKIVIKYGSAHVQTIFWLICCEDLTNMTIVPSEMKLPLKTIDTCQTTFDGILKVHVPKYVLQFSKNRWPTLLSICLPSQKVAIQINLKILLHTQFTFYVHSQWWMTSEAKYCMLVYSTGTSECYFSKNKLAGSKKQDFWPNAYIRFESKEIV